MIANATIASKTEISAPELLWTNPNPNTSFAAQNVTVSGDYDEYIVEVEFSITDTSAQYTYQILVPNIISTSTHPRGFFLSNTLLYKSYGSDGNPVYRRINSLTNGAFAFGDGKHRDSDVYSTNNQYAVPTRIWGVKWSF